MNSIDKVKKILEVSYNKEISDKIVDTYQGIHDFYILEQWKTSELEAGHFVESVIRLLQLELLKIYTPFSSKLPQLNDAFYKGFETATGDDSYRLLIPRILISIYGIRSKRGVGHTGIISPNEMDATLILEMSKWVLAEIVRLKSNLSLQETKDLIDSIINRNLSLIWEIDGKYRILKEKLTIKEKIIILLYLKKTLTINEILNSTEYKNKSRLSIVISRMHSERLIELSHQECTISPKGTKLAQDIIIKL